MGFTHACVIITLCTLNSFLQLQNPLYAQRREKHQRSERPLGEGQNQPVGVLHHNVISVHSSCSQETLTLVEPHCGFVRAFGLQNHLICLLCLENIHLFADQLLSDSLASPLLLHCQHSNISSCFALLVAPKTAYNYTYNFVGILVIVSEDRELRPVFEEVQVDRNGIWLCEVSCYEFMDMLDILIHFINVERPELHHY